VKAIAKNISEFRQDYLYTVTLPWGDDGWRLIPAQRISEFRAKFRHHEDIHNQLVQDFLASYEDKIEKAKVDLAGLFSRTEYPSLEAVTAKYRFKLDWNSIADADDLRVQISEEASGEIRKAITEATEAKLSRAVAETHKRAHEVVTAVVDRLTEDENGDHKIFRDSLIGNIRDLAEILPSLNVTNDPTLAKVAEDLHNKLGKLDPEVLRNEPAAAKAAVKTAQDILAELSGAI
jgi:predicted secreted Zn-dependent protease